MLNAKRAFAFSRYLDELMLGDAADNCDCEYCVLRRKVQAYFAQAADPNCRELPDMRPELDAVVAKATEEVQRDPSRASRIKLAELSELRRLVMKDVAERTDRLKAQQAEGPKEAAPTEEPRPFQVSAVTKALVGAILNGSDTVGISLPVAENALVAMSVCEWMRKHEYDTLQSFAARALADL